MFFNPVIELLLLAPKEFRERGILFFRIFLIIIRNLRSENSYTFINIIMKVIPIGPLGQYDNYVYAIYSNEGQTMALVDPAEWPSVKQFIRGHPVLSGLTLTHVLTTHKHHDHAEDNRRIA